MQTIASVMIRYGFGDAVAASWGIGTVFGEGRPGGSTGRAWNGPPASPHPNEMCLALEELGPTFMKLGSGAGPRV